LQTLKLGVSRLDLPPFVASVGFDAAPFHCGHVNASVQGGGAVKALRL